MAGAPAPDLSAIPHLTPHYYDVGGLTVRQVRAQLNAVRPTDPTDRAPMDAVTIWNFKWHWPGRDAAHCDLSSATVDYHIDLTLPRLVVTDDTPTAVKIKWGIYLEALTRHELHHVDLVTQGAAAMLAAIKSASCNTADEAARGVLAQIARENWEYDQETDHGVQDGVHLP